MRRKSLDTAPCPVARTLDVIGDWWSLLILRDAFSGLRRFGEFQKSLGLAKNILAARLKTLVAQGILESVPAADGSAYRDYVLTAKGRALFPVLVALREWGEAYRFEGETCPVELVERTTGRPVHLDLRTADDRHIPAGETLLRPRIA